MPSRWRPGASSAARSWRTCSSSVDALSSAQPKRRYLVVPVANQATLVMRKLIDEMVELNADQPYTIDRETLVKMLYEALARRKS